MTRTHFVSLNQITRRASKQPLGIACSLNETSGITRQFAAIATFESTDRRKLLASIRSHLHA